MELAYQGLFIRLPFEGAVGVEAFEMNASFNDHVTLRLLLLVEEEKIEALIHGIGDGDDIEVYKAEADGLLYAGKITDAKMEQDRSLHLLQLEAASYTMDWGLAPVSQSVLPVIFIPLWYRTAVRRMDGPILEFRIWGKNRS